MRRRMLAGVLTTVALLLSIAVVPAAWAGDQVDAATPVTELPATSPSGTVALAHTGLNIMIPTAIGLAVLLLGTALVAWAVLRGSRSRSSRP